MIKRYVMEPLCEGPDSGPSGSVWIAVGHRLRRRRTELGYSLDHVAHWAGIAPASFEAYESGVPVPASLLAQIADLFGTPVVWFFQGIADEEPPEVDAGADTAPIAYMVATVEHRVQALADSFRKLDFEGQQHLLAISQALSRSNSRSNANAPRG